jgi:hypothetical protein
LEQTIGRAAEHPHVCNIVFVDADGKVTSSLILEPGKPNRWTEGASDTAGDKHEQAQDNESNQQPNSQA